MRQLVFDILYYLGVSKILFAVNKHQMKVPVLVFHRISPDWDEFTEPMNPTVFEDIIRMLKRNYKVKPLTEFEDCKNIDTLKGCCFITFDDGMFDFYKYAYPIIKKHKIPIGMFLPTACINAQCTIWNFELFGMIKHSSIHHFSIDIGENKFHFCLKSDSEKLNAAKQLNNLLLQLPHTSVLQLLQELQTKLCPSKIDEYPVMTWEQVNTIKSEGLVSFYSHTANHAYLPSEEYQNVESELIHSKEHLSKEAYTSKNYLAYPIGGYNRQVLKSTKKHYALGFSVDEQQVKLNKLKNSDYKYRLPRFNMSDKTAHEIFFRINGFHKLINKIC